MLDKLTYNYLLHNAKIVVGIQSDRNLKSI